MNQQKTAYKYLRETMWEIEQGIPPLNVLPERLLQVFTAKYTLVYQAQKNSNLQRTTAAISLTVSANLEEDHMVSDLHLQDYYCSHHFTKVTIPNDQHKKQTKKNKIAISGTQNWRGNNTHSSINEIIVFNEQPNAPEICMPGSLLV